MSRSANSTRTSTKADNGSDAEKLARLLKEPQPVATVKPAPQVVQAVLTPNPDEPGKAFGGSEYADFNKAMVSQVQAAVWAGNANGIEELTHLALSAAGGLAGMKPQDPVEGMLAAQMVATHNATMECFRRAMIRDQTMEGRNSSLAHANKLTRSFATLSMALDKHRGQGKQTVRVEHVHVYDGGQAIVGPVDMPGRISASEFNRRVERVTEDALRPGKKMTGIEAMRLAARCGAFARTTGKPCCGPAMANGRCRMHGGPSTGPAKGSKNALKHGFYMAEAIEFRRGVASLCRTTRDMVRDLEG